MSFKSYEEYKYSGVEWLGEVPSHWQINALSRALKCAITDGPHSTPEFLASGIPFLSVDGIQDGALNFDKCRYISKEDHQEFSKKAKPIKNDILMGKAASIGKIARVKSDIEFNIWSPLALIRIDTKKGSPGYFEHALKSQESQYQIEQKANSNTQLNIGMKDICKIRLCYPEPYEQHIISDFLDHETARIDALIEEQKRLITLLKEKRQAVISHAVTKGLDPDVPMKDSGVAWLGEVPAHWIVAKSKWYITTTSGGTPPSSQREEYYDGDIPWLRTLDLNNSAICEAEIYVTDKAIADTACRIVPKGSVLIAMYGGDGSVGKNGLLTFNSSINQAICAFLPNTNFNPNYLHKYMQFYRPYWMVGAESSRKDPNIGQDRIGDSHCLIPPIEEQEAISAYLMQKIAEMELLEIEANNMIVKLSERRSALISAAVTGKIDVRDWQPPKDNQTAAEPAEASA